MLSALLSLVDPGERIVLVEDASELRPDHPHVVALEGRPANIEGAGEISLQVLVRQALRMRPDRLVVGEVRGAEVVDLLAALNTGHGGGCGTLHANSAADVPARVEALSLAAGLPRSAAHSQLASALDVVIHLGRGRDGRRRVLELGVPERDGSGHVALRTAATFEADRVVRGPAAGALAARLGLGGVVSAWLVALLAGMAVAALVPSAGPVPRRPGRSRQGWSVPVPVLARRRRVAADQAAVLEVCDLLAADLAAGRPPDAALAAGAERWPPLVPVVEAMRLGADVPEAMRRLAAERRGAADLRWVAGAWQVAQHSGHGLAAALERTAAGLRARRRTRRLVDSELASARSTARLVACLPVAVLLMGSGAGSDPWSFLLATPVGWLCGAAGLTLVALGLWWIERLADQAAAP